jgi:hypothetical protein
VKRIFAVKAKHRAANAAAHLDGGACVLYAHLIVTLVPATPRAGSYPPTQRCCVLNKVCTPLPFVPAHGGISAVQVESVAVHQHTSLMHPDDADTAAASADAAAARAQGLTGIQEPLGCHMPWLLRCC